MNSKSKLEAAFGEIKESKWKAAATKWQQELPWKNHAQQIALEILDHLDKMDKSQKEFAQMMGVSPQLASKWLKGNVNFTIETISKIETILGISLIQVGAQNNPANMVMAKIETIRDAYQKPNHVAEEHPTKASKVIKLHNVYGGFSIAN